MESADFFATENTARTEGEIDGGDGAAGRSPGPSADAPEGSDHSLAKDDIGLAQFFTVKPSEIHIEQKLGAGAQADVYKATWTRKFVVSTSSIVVAVKRLRLDLGPVYRDREALAILTDHPNIVKCFDCTVDPPYLVISEYCAGGSLFDLLYNTRIELTLRQRIKILADVARGMRYLHEQRPRILHRDLKSSNVLLMKPIRSREQEPFAKVADFGLARLNSEAATLACMTVGVGTWRWMAPEVFDNDSDSAGQYCETADVFSFAMLMYETLVGKLPYSETFPQDSADPRIGLHIIMGMRPELQGLRDVPAVVTELMERSWCSEPKDRPPFQELDTVLQEVYSQLPKPGGV
mmetsp:Transcript_58513/g.154078  ORF Transcript_58513/g.154078 Transcript_58513/m.154078 type:complete len:350 (-) Transcript_58513:256-1305(-)